jgi:Eukaryotic initiation factor 4E
MSFLNDTWILYFHDPADSNWDNDSYKKIATISTVEEFVQVFGAFHNMWSKGMFFIFREHSFPTWEHETNCQGGCLSYKINRTDVPKGFFELAAHILGETAIDDGEKRITGISISPKRNYCIARIWVSNTCYSNSQELAITFPPYTNVQFKSHADDA